MTVVERHSAGVGVRTVGGTWSEARSRLRVQLGRQ